MIEQAVFAGVSTIRKYVVDIPNDITSADTQIFTVDDAEILSNLGNEDLMCFFENNDPDYGRDGMYRSVTFNKAIVGEDGTEYCGHTTRRNRGNIAVATVYNILQDRHASQSGGICLSQSGALTVSGSANAPVQSGTYSLWFIW